MGVPMCVCVFILRVDVLSWCRVSLLLAAAARRLAAHVLITTEDLKKVDVQHGSGDATTTSAVGLCFESVAGRQDGSQSFSGLRFGVSGSSNGHL